MKADHRSDNFPLFDSLRAIGLLMVMGHHGLLQAGEVVPKASSLLAATGLPRYMIHWDAGVTIFFLISGFLLYRPFAKASYLGRTTPSIRNFAIRRITRIVPAYWVALTLLTIAVGIDGVFTAKGIPTYYGFAQIYSGGTAIGGIGQAWTLCVEIVYYAFLPVWVIALATRPRATGTAWLRRELVWLGALAAFSIAWKMGALLHVDANRYDALPFLMPLPAYIDQVVIGMAFASLSVWVSEHRAGVLWPRLQWIDEHPGRAWWGAFALWFVMTNFTPIPNRLGVLITDKEYLLRHELNGLIAGLIMAPFVFGDQRKGRLRRAMGWRPLAYLGTIAYGVYLYHLAVFRQLLEHDTIHISGYPTLLAYWFAGIAITVAIATVSWYVLELPIMRWAKRLERRRPPAAPPEPAPASGFAG